MLIFALVFLLTALAFWRVESFKRFLTYATKKKDNSYDNVIILSALGYYNININAIKTSFVAECINYFLYCSDPNYTISYNFVFDDFILDEYSIDELYSKFKEHCISQNKNNTDFTFNELTTFIKNQDIYKDLEKKLNYRLSRAIVLSKYLNNKDVDELLDVLTDKEKEILTS